MNRQDMLTGSACGADDALVVACTTAVEAGRVARDAAELYANCRPGSADYKAIQAQAFATQSKADELVRNVARMEATTQTGARAHATVLCVSLQPEAADADCNGCFLDQGQIALLRRLLIGLSDAAPDDERGTNSDAELIADCAEFDALEWQHHAVRGDEPEQDAERERLEALQEPLVSRIVDARTVSVAGAQARARSLILWDPSAIKPGAGDTGQRLAHGLLRDLAGEAFVSAVMANMLGGCVA